MATQTAKPPGTMAKQKAMGKAPSLGGPPAMQAMAGAMGGDSRPMRSPGKPAKSIKGLPPGKASTQRAKQPKGKTPPSFRKGNIKGIKKSAAANVKGGSQSRK